MARSRRLVWQSILFGCGLSLTVSGMSQQLPLRQPPPLELVWRTALPTAPLLRPEEKVFLGLDGKALPITTITRSADTRRELAHLPIPSPTQTSNQARGNQGVKIGERVVVPFGSKGERVGIAFGSGFFVPPIGEKIQPALQQLAQSRLAIANPEARNRAAEETAVYALLLLNGRLMPDLQTRLRELGVTLYAHYPNTAWQVRLPAHALQAVAALSEVRWIGQPDTHQKLHRDLWAIADAPKQARREQKFYVALFAPDTTGEMRAALQEAGGTIHLYDKSIQVVQVNAAPDALLRMAALDSVLFVEPVPVFQAHDTQSMSAINADWLWGNFAPSNSVKVKVGILDSGLDIYHTDFANIFGGTIGYNWITGENWWNDGRQHGTHVAGTFFGEGRGQGRYRGVAANMTQRGSSADPDLVVARVLDNSGFSVGNSVFEGLQAVNGEFYALDRVQVFNASLGANGLNLTGTDTNSRKVDELVRNNILAVLSAGNSGYSASGGTIGAPGVAKNALTVGSVNDSFGPYGLVGWPGNNDDVATYSSRGPTGDGRTKPDVVAPGSWIDSVDAGTASGYLYDWTGTSMAAPHVAGLAAGIIAHFDMPAWATKAAIIASAYETGLGRDNAGFGKVDAMLAHYSIDGTWIGWWSENGGTGDTRYVDFTLPAYASRVRVVLVWPDEVAASGASISTVNDVDLGLQWGTLTTDWARNLSATSSRQTVEVIDADGLGAGTYRIKVHSYSVSGTQPWALVVKVIYGSLSPNITLTLNTPHAVQPNTAFYAQANAQAGSHVASSVYSSIGLGAGFSLDGLWYNRRGNPSSGDEWVWFPNPRDTTIGYSSPFAMNQGSIAAGYTRTFWWQPKSGSTEGTWPITYSVSSRNGGSGSITNNVIVDGTPPAMDPPNLWYWTGLLATTYCWTNDSLAGLNVGSGYYAFSRDGGATWSSWIPTPCTGSNGITSWQYLYALDVPFNQNSTNNLILYAIADMAGNWSYSPVSAIWTYATLTGTVTLEGPSSMAQPITLEFRPTDGSPSFSRTTTPDAGGNYTIGSLEPREYTVHIKGSKWLAKNVGFNLTLGDVTLGSVFLKGGDANNDNQVNVLDLDKLIQSFSKCVGDAAYDANADFNCDGCTNVLDLDILIRNFDEVGDP